MSIPICPILTMQTPSMPLLCLLEDCAFYLSGAKKCAVTVLGFHAMAEVQRLQHPAPPKAP